MATDNSIVEVVNRTTQSLDFMFDGVPGVVYPGYKLDETGKPVPAGRDGYPRTTSLTKPQAEYARRQNVKMGSEDPRSGDLELLVGVGIRDEEGCLTADPNWIMNSISYTPRGDSLERFDRSTMPEMDRGVSLGPAHGMQGRGAAAVAPFQYQDGAVDTSRPD